MNKKKIRMESDLSFLAIIFLQLVCLIFVGTVGEEYWEFNTIMFCAGSIAILITYFFSITAGLIADLLIIFSYITYILYGILYTGESVDWEIYFWLIWIPIVTVAFYFFSTNMKTLQSENTKLKQNIEEIALIDENTGLENLYGFEKDCSIYMKIADRYEMPLVLLVWDLRYENELLRLLGKQRFTEQVQFISDIAKNTLRKEDTLFLLQDSPYLWGAIMFTNVDGEKIVIDRLKKRIQEEKKNTKNEKMQIDLRFGMATYENKEETPLELLERSKKRLDYDVS